MDGRVSLSVEREVSHHPTTTPSLLLSRFAYLARKGIQILQGKIKLMAFECAFTVEGRTDEELPEVRAGEWWMDGWIDAGEGRLWH